MTAETVQDRCSALVAELRDTAALMRKRAQAASPGPWVQMTDYGLLSNPCAVHRSPEPKKPGWTLVCDGNLWQDTEEDTAQCEADAVHIAAFASPAVALATADWIDDEAGALEVDLGENSDRAHVVGLYHSVFTVARVYRRGAA